MKSEPKNLKGIQSHRGGDVWHALRKESIQEPRHLGVFGRCVIQGELYREHRTRNWRAAGRRGVPVWCWEKVLMTCRLQAEIRPCLPPSPCLKPELLIG